MSPLIPLSVFLSFLLFTAYSSNYSKLPDEIKRDIVFEHLPIDENQQIRLLNKQSYKLFNTSHASKLYLIPHWIKLSQFLMNLNISKYNRKNLCISRLRDLCDHVKLHNASNQNYDIQIKMVEKLFLILYTNQKISKQNRIDITITLYSDIFPERHSFISLFVSLQPIRLMASIINRYDSLSYYSISDLSVMFKFAATEWNKLKLNTINIQNLH